MTAIEWERRLGSELAEIHVPRAPLEMLNQTPAWGPKMCSFKEYSLEVVSETRLTCNLVKVIPRGMKTMHSHTQLSGHLDSSKNTLQSSPSLDSLRNIISL